MEKLDALNEPRRVRTSITIGHISESFFEKYKLGELSALHLKNTLQAAYFNQTGIWQEMETHRDFIDFRNRICESAGVEIQNSNCLKLTSSYLEKIIAKALNENQLDFDALNEKTKLFLKDHKYYGPYRQKIKEICVAYYGSVEEFHSLIPKQILLKKAASRDLGIKSVNHQQEALKEGIYSEYACFHRITHLLEREKTVAKMQFLESACISSIDGFPYTYEQVLGFLILGKSKELIETARKLRCKDE